ncbi:MAG: DUF6048 family protein [Mangrovibacterium sp.]
MKIFNYFLIITLVSLATSVNAEEKKKAPKAEKYWHETGLRLGTDITRPFQGLWTKGDRWGMEFFGDFEVSPDVFVVAEAGWEKFSMQHPHVDYSGNGTYLRLGADYNLLHVPNEKEDKSSLYFGARYGFGNAVQTVDGYQIDNYWGTFSGSFSKQNYFSHWAELVFGMKTEIVHNIYLGWNVRAKFMIGDNSAEIPPAYFVPGCGTADKNVNFDFNYSIMYSLPFNIGKRYSDEEKAELEASKK